jgi:hypothetical protein
MALGELAAWLALALGVLLGLLLAMQTMRLKRLERQFRALMKGTGPHAAAVSFGELVAGQGAHLEQTRAEVQELKGTVNALQLPVARSLQCVGLVRYNPFQDTGGDQSFSLALLDRKGDGVVVSSLHGRTGTRFYAKPVKGGESALSLSTEEAQAIQQAMNGKREA